MALVLASSFSAALFAGESLMLPVGEKATRCDWELIPYETVDGMKGKFAHISPSAKTNSRVEVPLNVKGRYRIWLGVVVKRWMGYVLHVKLGKEKYPVRMHADFNVDDIPSENPIMGELEFTVADLDNDMLIVRNATGSPGGFRKPTARSFLSARKAARLWWRRTIHIGITMTEKSISPLSVSSPTLQ